MNTVITCYEWQISNQRVGTIYSWYLVSQTLPCFGPMVQVQNSMTWNNATNESFPSESQIML